MTEIVALHKTLEQELVALIRGASMECLVCGEFVLHRGRALACPECGSVVRAEGGSAGAQLEFDAQAG
jgi:Zn finger protein HypA/HybF involved in hydrogenase expression